MVTPGLERPSLDKAQRDTGKKQEGMKDAAFTSVHSNGRTGPPERADTASESRQQEQGLWHCTGRNWWDQGRTMSSEHMRNEVCPCREPQPRRKPTTLCPWKDSKNEVG